MAQHTQSTLSHRLIELRSRLNFSQVQMAQYLGVPVFTLRKWESGEREPQSVLTRLLDILGIVETFAPSIHDALMPDAHVDKVRVKPKRHVGKVPASPSLT